MQLPTRSSECTNHRPILRPWNSDECARVATTGLSAPTRRSPYMKRFVG